MRVTDNETRWAKIGLFRLVSFAGKDILLYGNGCHLVFINLITGEELVYTGNTSKSGDGIQSFGGHRTQNIFAFAEKRTNPAIFVKKYPHFEEICALRDGEERGYISMTFSETSLLLTLGDLPGFKLTIWNWRKGERIACQNSGILMQDQVLKANFSSPVFLAQLATNTHQMRLWDVFICGKKCILTQHTIKLEEKKAPFSSMLWTTEGGLFVLDTLGCIYTMFPDHHLEKVIEFTQPGDFPTTFTWYKFGIVVAGPNNEIRQYKKSGLWSLSWSMQLTQPIWKLFSRFDFLVGLTTKYDLVQILLGSSEIKPIKRNQSLFDDFCLIYPTGKYILVLSRQNRLDLYTVETGELMSSLLLEGTALQIVENPRFPYAAVGLDNGMLKLISVYNPETICNLTRLHLMKTPVEKIHFNDCGTILVAANLRVGRFFIVEGLPGGQMTILTTFDVQQQIAHFTMVVSQDCFRIFMIPVTSNKFIAGNVILRLCLVKNKKDIKEFAFEDSNSLYQRLVATYGPKKDRVLYAIPFFGKTINEVELKKGDIVAKIHQKVVTGHQIRDVFFRLDKQFALTWSSDGFIVARSFDFGRNIALALPHHRMLGGVKKAYIGPKEKFIVSLGRDGVLVCTNLMEKQVDPELEQDLEDIWNSPDYQMMFSRHTVGFMPKGIYAGKCYLEVQEMKKLEKEEQQCRVEREAIWHEFRSIRHELQELLTSNLLGPDNEKLDLKEFDLNPKLYEEKAAKNKKLCVATEVYLKNLIDAHNTIADYMMENFWVKMKTPGTAIKAIFARFEVNNYILRPENEILQDVLKWIRHQRRMERYLSEMNSFHPWVPVSEEHLKVQISGRPSLPAADEQLTMLYKLDADAPEEEEPDEDVETKIAFSGSDLARFIEVQDAHYLQNELQTYFQTELQWIISKSDCNKLKEHFNDHFNKTATQKLKEMSNIKMKNDRLRHIVSELNYFSEEQVFMRIEDPQWEQIENPEQITQVKKEEVAIAPYISPSEQAIIDAKAAEAERIRLLLLADDFRERALMAMMNGVLEVRWEDELRKNVPKPKCMLEKVPESYNEDDLRAVKDYEEKVEFLNSERERYKRLLRDEYAKVAHGVRENINKFNGKLGDLLCMKLQVDAALSQESLKINRMKLFQHKRKLMFRKEQEILKKISENDEVISSLLKLTHELHDSLHECRNYVETFQLKDKILERAYKKDFQDMSPVVQEQATKIFKKRPKVNLKTIISTSLLNELGKCAAANVKPSLTLTNECLDFLKQLDALDMYVGVPTVVDERTFSLICKHRRLRIEYEVKLRAAQNEVTVAETTSAAFYKRLSQKKENGAKLHAELTQVRKELIHMMCDSDMQIVLPRGLVEIPLCGSFEDFEDAVLVCRKDVEDINRIILDFGETKIKAMQTAMTFRRKILHMEWEHKRMKMQIQDLEEKIVDIDGVRLTKEIQSYLKCKDKSKTIPFETKVDMVKGSYEKTIQDRRDKVLRMQKQINSIRDHDKIVEHKIHEHNMDVCELNLMRDQDLDDKERQVIDMRMKTLQERSKLIHQIQDNHHEILMLQTELELLRLKTYPTLKYKVV